MMSPRNTIRRCLFGLALCAGLLGSAARADVVLQVEDGLLAGAEDVIVNGAPYNVSFQDGSCNTLQLGCTRFTFDNALDAGAAAQALLDQVFTGIYDVTPSLTRGCTLTGGCLVSTIYGPTPSDTSGSNLATTTNSVVEANDNVVTRGFIGATFDTTPIPAVTVALWKFAKPAQVPEPASLGLALAGLAVLGVVRRRRPR